MDNGPAHRFGGDADESGVRVTSDDDGAVLHVVVRGRWDWGLTRMLRTTVDKCLAEHPTALIVNLRAADDPSGSSAPLLVLAHRVGRAMRPPVPIAVCVATGSDLESRLQTMGAAWFLPLFSTVPQARVALERDLAVPDHLQLNLRPLPHSPERARRLVAEAGHGWALPELVHPAELVMSELVTNAVRHAGTDMLVTVSRRGTGLYLTVCDGSIVLPPLPGRPHAADGARLDEHGYGLWLVDQVATAWGARLSHQRPGKVVWAVVRNGSPGRRAASSPPPPPYLQVGPAKAAASAPTLSAVALSSREQEVLSYLPTMLTAEDIASRLQVSVHTVRAHLKSIYRKLGVSRRQDAVDEAIKQGLL